MPKAPAVDRLTPEERAIVIEMVARAALARALREAGAPEPCNKKIDLRHAIRKEVATVNRRSTRRAQG